MKKVLAVWMILMMLVPVFGAAEGTEDGSAAGTPEALPMNLNYSYDELTVGSTMPMYGAFSFANWGNSESDVDVRNLIHDYNLVMWDSGVSGFRLNPGVVSGHLVEGAENGDHIYWLYLRNDLFFSDGTPITAYDYAFSFLLRMSPVIAELGGIPSRMDYLAGYSEYVSGETDVLAGIGVSGPFQMSIRISADYLPFFFEEGLLDCYPVPIRVIAPGCEVTGGRNGVGLSVPLSAEGLRETLLDPENGYLSHPSVVTGAYRLVSYDGEEVRFELNEYYKGNSDGAKPMIPRIVFRTADQATMIEDLAGAKYGLLNKVTRAEAIQAGLQLGVDTGRYDSTNYFRTGLSFIAFNIARDGVGDVTVRQAIAKCLDKEGLTTDYTGDYGLKADGFYGLGQWMYQIMSGVITPDVPEDATAEEIAQSEQDWQEINLEGVEKYDFDPAGAAEMLEAAGWQLNADGVREKDGVTLDLTMVYPASTPIRDILEARFAEPLKQAGIRLTLTESDRVLPMYYGQEERTYDMAWLATNFEVLFDPSPLFEPDGAANTTGIADEELYELAADMKRTQPGDLLEYCRKWIRFLTRFAEVEPMIPVYSNVYFDFYPDVLQQYDIMENITWSEAVVASYLSDPPQAQEGTGGMPATAP